MKKLILILLMISISFYISLNIVASEIETQILDITSQFNTWTLKNNGDVYYIESNRVINSAESIEIELGTTFSASDAEYYDADGDGEMDDLNPYHNIANAFVASYGTETSRITVYSTLTSTTIIDTFNLTYEAYEATETLWLNSQTMADPDWGASFDLDTYYALSIVLSDALSSDQRNRIVDVFNSGGAWGSMIPGETYLLNIIANVVSVYIDPTIASDLELLPNTYGSIFDEINQMGDVSIDALNNYEIDISISYDTIYYLRYTFSENTDMTIFNNAYEAFYYTYNDQHFIVLNHGTQSLFKMNNWATQSFIPYTIWNLDTNELVEHNQVNVYLHLKLGDANHIIGYFYMDDFVIDRLLQVSTVFNYRWDPLVGSKSDWIPQAVILEDDTLVNPSVAWQYSAAATSIAATATIAGILGATGVGITVALPVLLIGGIVSAYFTYVAFDYDGSLISGSTTEIQEANPDAELLNEITTAYSNHDDDFTSVNLSEFPLWKLDFGAYNKALNTAEIDAESVNVITMSYMSDGQVYVLEADKINTNATVDDYLNPDNDSTLFNPTGTDPLFNIVIPWYYWLGGGILAYLLFKDLKLAKKPGLVILILAVIIYGLLKLGLI
ncbi:MAG: hypothetical protein K8Q99_02090 [Acholeplasmataceae bacterium]|nr:hypothetical protein [Acholeplasmataceae bacterium]MCD4826556.1 hypothetical protein [Acholeplasmataceae bacterium]